MFDKSQGKMLRDLLNIPFTWLISFGDVVNNTTGSSVCLLNGVPDAKELKREAMTICLVSKWRRRVFFQTFIVLSERNEVTTMVSELP